MGLRGRHADDVTSASAITGRRKNFTVRVLRGQPSWVAPTLALILLAAGLLYTWNIGYSGLSTYYAAAVKSMAASPGAMFFGALDPSSTITLDKLAGFLIPQVLAVKLFGFHAWALSLPQAIEGVITIFFAYVIGTRWRGSIFGLIVAVVAAFTPMLAAMFGRPMEDGMLTMCQVLAFAALQRAILSQQTRWLMISGAWVAVGFQAKMLQSWLFLPALIVVWLVGSDAPLGRRFRQAAVACAICVLLSVSWMTAIQLVPVSSRPYVDGTTNNNMYSMVFGYNGVDRLIPGIVPGAVPQLGTVHGAGQSSGNTTATSSAGKSKAKLLLPQFTTQIGWLYPLAAAGMVLAATRWRRRGPRRASESVTDLPPPASVRERASWATAVGLAVWLAVAAIVLSAAFVPHATYFAVIALPIALFAVDGVFASLRLFRTARNWRWMILPVLVVWRPRGPLPSCSNRHLYFARWLSPQQPLAPSALHFWFSVTSGIREHCAAFASLSPRQVSPRWSDPSRGHCASLDPAAAAARAMHSPGHAWRRPPPPPSGRIIILTVSSCVSRSTYRPSPR